MNGFSCYSVVTNNTIWGAEKGGIILSHGTWANDTPAANQCPSTLPENYETYTNNILGNTQSTNASGGGAAFTIFGGCASGNPNYGTNNLISNNQAEFNAGNNGLTDTCSPATGLTFANPATADSSASATFLNYQANGSGTYSLESGSHDIQAGTTSCAPTQSGCVPTTDLLQNSWRPPNYDVGAYRF
jgi:hypothetical protein